MYLEAASITFDFSYEQECQLMEIHSRKIGIWGNEVSVETWNFWVNLRNGIEN